jgi:hypothetical protein
MMAIFLLVMETSMNLQARRRTAREIGIHLVSLMASLILLLKKKWTDTEASGGTHSLRPSFLQGSMSPTSLHIASPIRERKEAMAKLRTKITAIHLRVSRTQEFGLDTFESIEVMSLV